MKNVVNSNASIYEILRTYPELVNLLAKMGFDELTNPSFVRSLGRVTTLQTLAKQKNIDFNLVKQEFSKNNYDLGPK